jgi:WD40 repeat protein
MTEADLEGFVFDEQGVVHSLAAGRDSAGRTLIAAGMDDGTVIVFRPGISQLHRMVEHYDFVRAMAWHPTSPTLVTGGNDNRVLVWNVDRMALEYRLSTLPACVRSLSFSSNGNLLIGVAWQEGVHVWDFVARQGIRVISVPAVKACIHPAGDRCVVSTIDGRLLVYDLGTGRLVGTLANINAIARALAFSPDGKYLVAGSWDGVVRVWDLSRAPILVAEFSGHADLIDAVAFGPSDGFLLSADWSGRLFTWDIQTTAVIMRVQAHSDIVNGVVSIPAEQWVITASNDARTRVWQATSFELVEDRLLSGHKTTIQCRGTLLRNVRNMQFERLAFLQRRGAVV